MKWIFKALLFFCCSLRCYAQGVSGYLKEKESGEAIANATIKSLTGSSFSNNYGYFYLQANLNDELIISALGYNTKKLLVTKELISGSQIIDLEKKDILLNEVVVIGNEDRLFDRINSGKINFSKDQIKKIPMLLGEKDPIKALQFLPGIQEISEGSSSLSVRGGDVDQNLLILDEAVVYNANHLFGFFSTFNANPIKHIDEYKSYFPAEYGGRLSSIIDVRLREGNNQKIKAEGGVGLISSRLMLEGPIQKNKSSFLVSGRRTYADKILIPLQNPREKTGYFFGDINAKLNFEMPFKSRLYLSFYTGQDSFYQKNKIPRRESFLLNNSNLDWSNLTLTSRWNKIYIQRIFQNLTLIYSQYHLKLGENTSQDYLNPPRFEDVKISSTIKDFGAKIDFEYFRDSKFNLKWGGNLTNHYFVPRRFKYSSANLEQPVENNSRFENVNEAALYVNTLYKNKKYFHQIGLRLSYFQKPHYLKLEPRILLGMEFSDKISSDISFSRTNQYLHLISNTGNGLPTDVWIPSTSNLKNSTVDQINYHLSYKPSSGLDLVFETYYKWITGNTTYKSGASFLGIADDINKPFLWEDNLLQGRSWAYGYEFSFHKTKGKLTGFGGYTLAWSVAQFDKLNNGKPFYNRQDRRHILETSLAYQAKKRIKISSNFIFATGNAFSIPEGIFFTQDAFLNYIEAYSGVNNFRAENFHRLDLGVIIDSKKRNSNWEFSIYNVYNRKNPYGYTTQELRNQTNNTITIGIKRLWLVPIIPSITYNFKIG